MWAPAYGSVPLKLTSEDFNSRAKIERTLIAPMGNLRLAVEKVVAGTLQAMVLASWQSARGCSSARASTSHVPHHMLLRLCVARGALLRDCGSARLQSSRNTSDEVQIVVATVDLFGLHLLSVERADKFNILQRAVLANHPLCTPAKALRATMIPKLPHLHLLPWCRPRCFSTLVLATGLRNFQASPHLSF